MGKIAICMANGSEEIEGLTVVDLLRRENIDIDMISIHGDELVTGSHGIRFYCDRMIEDVDWDEYDGIILPGGMPGTVNLEECDIVRDTLCSFMSSGKLVAAICAAPSILGHLGLTAGRRATSYPGYDRDMEGCIYMTDPVVTDGNLITGRGMGTAVEFGLAIVEYLSDVESANALADKIVYMR